MSEVPLYAICKASTPVTTLLGSNPMRMYAFGLAPQNVTKPYVVWSLITGIPGNNLSVPPDHDYFNTQIDIFADTGVSAEAVKDAMRAAIEEVTHIATWNGEGRDPSTKNYRITFSVDWFVKR